MVPVILVVNMDNLITAGELAKLASTTKRTIIWYTEQGVLKPVRIMDNGYRYYNESQVLEYQMILLLRTLNVSLSEIKDYLSKKGKITDLFNEKKQQIRQEIDNLQYKLKSVEGYLDNLKGNGTMVDPKIINMEPFEVYYIDKVGSYAEIGRFCTELISMFEVLPAHHTAEPSLFTTLAIFPDPTYQPRKCKMKIGVLAKPYIKIKSIYNSVVNKMLFAPGKVITYTFNGSGNNLSLFWKELEKYCRLHHIKARTDTPDFEIYRTVHPDPAKQFFEIYLPVSE